MIVLRFKSKEYTHLYLGPSDLEGKFSHCHKFSAYRFKSVNDAQFAVKDWVRHVWPDKAIEEVYEPEEVES
jgi:hypothetical protein